MGSTSPGTENKPLPHQSVNGDASPLAALASFVVNEYLPDISSPKVASSAVKTEDEPPDGSRHEKSDIFSGDRKRSDSRRGNKRAFEAAPNLFHLFLPQEAVRQPSLLTCVFLI